MTVTTFSCVPATIVRGIRTITLLVGVVAAVSMTGTTSQGEDAAPVASEETPIFTRDVLPLLQKNCLACHHAKLSEGGLSLESLASIRQGGDSGPALDTEDPPLSILLERARGDSDSIMPPEDNSVGAVPLNESELAIIERWIASGAGDGPALAAATIDWSGLPDQLNAIYAVAYAPRGGWAAVGRGNSIALINDSDGSIITYLHDPALSPPRPAGAIQSATGSTASPSPAAQVDFVNSIAIHPSGDFVASGDYRSVRIWRRASDPSLMTNANDVAVNSPAELLLAAMRDLGGGTPRGAADDEALQRASQWDLGGTMRQMTVSADRRVSLTMTNEGPVRLWDFNEGRLIADLTMPHPSAWIKERLSGDVGRQTAHVAFLGGLVAEAEALIQKEEEARVKAEEADTKQREDVTAKQMLVTAAEANLQTVAAADPPPAEEQKVAAQKAVDDAVAALQASEALAVATGQGLAAAMDTRDRATQALEALRAEIQREQERATALQGELDAIAPQAQDLGQPLAVAFADGRPAVALAYHDGVVATFSTQDGRLLNRFAGAPTGEFTLHVVDDTWLVAFGKDENLVAWRLGGSWKLDRVLGDLVGESPFSDRVTALDFSPDGRYLIAGGGSPSRSGELHRIDVESWEISAAWTDRHSDTVHAVRVSPDGRLIASCGADRQIYIADFPSGENPRSFEGHTHHVLGVAWQDHNRRIVSAGADESIKVWNVRTGEAERTIAAGSKEVTSVAFAGATAHFVATSGEGTVRLYNADDGAVLRTYGSVVGFQYASDSSAAGDRILAGGDDGVIRVWKTEAPEPVHQIP